MPCAGAWLLGASGPNGPDMDGLVVRAAHGEVAVPPATVPWTLSLAIHASIAVDCGLENTRDKQGLLRVRRRDDGLQSGRVWWFASSRGPPSSSRAFLGAREAPYFAIAAGEQGWGAVLTLDQVRLMSRDFCMSLIHDVVHWTFAVESSQTGPDPTI